MPSHLLPPSQLLISLLPFCITRPLNDALSNGDEAEIVAVAGPASRMQLIIFYLASGVWKINSSFMDPRYSCASIYMVSLVGHRLTSNAALLSALVRIAPLSTIVLEMLLPLLQAAPRAGRWSRLGVAATLAFHFAIGVTPPPHNIAIYGVTTLTRLYFWMPQACAQACTELVGGGHGGGGHGGGGQGGGGHGGGGFWLGPAMLAFAVAVMAGVRTSDGHGNPGLVGSSGIDWCLGYVGAASVLLGRAMVIEAGREHAEMSAREEAAAMEAAARIRADAEARAARRGRERAERAANSPGTPLPTTPPLPNSPAAAAAEGVGGVSGGGGNSRLAAELAKAAEAAAAVAPAGEKALAALKATEEAYLRLIKEAEAASKAKAASKAAKEAAAKAAEEGGRGSWHGGSSWLVRPMAALALLYAFAMPMLGLQERGGCLMFSQLRFHAGSNHLLGLPTGLLQRAMAGGDPSSALSGGIVRIESFWTLHKTDWVSQQFAEQMPESTLAMMRAAGVPTRYVPVPYYHAGLAGLPIVSKEGVFFPHTLSALGLRRMLARARALGEPFEVAYVRLEAPLHHSEGDETWRRTARAGQRVVVREDPRRPGARSCKVRGGGDCDARERALLEPPSRHVWLTHWLMPMPNPIIEPHTSEMHCVSIS